MPAAEHDAEHLRVLRHMLGINTPDDRVPKPYRDYYCANPGDKKLHAMMALGLVEIYRSDKYEWFTTTDAGRAAGMASHRTIRNTKAKRIYSKFLDCKEAFQDLTFRDFLTHDDFRETRRAA